MTEIQDYIGDYELGDLVGEGATCYVYEATHRVSLKKYAVKIFKSTASPACFKNEIDALSTVYHPNVMHVHEILIGLNDEDIFNLRQGSPCNHEFGTPPRSPKTTSSNRDRQNLSKNVYHARSREDLCFSNPVRNDANGRAVQASHTFIRTPGSDSPNESQERDASHDSDSYFSFTSASEVIQNEPNEGNGSSSEIKSTSPTNKMLRVTRVSTEKKIKALVLPLASKGDVLSYLLKYGAFSEKMSRTVVKKLLVAIKACHDKGLVHRDLKPDNLLFTSDYNVLLSDFGFSRELEMSENGYKNIYDNLGSKGYTAPEVGDVKGYNKECDIWSLGVTLFVMVTGRPPYGYESSGDYWFNLLLRERHDIFWISVERLHSKSFPTLSKNLINRMLCPRPKDRISLDEIMRHPWMQQEALSSEEFREAIQELSQ